MYLRDRHDNKKAGQEQMALKKAQKCAEDILGHANALFRPAPQLAPLVTAPAYPRFVPMPGVRTNGYQVGCDVKLTETGATIRKSGYYLVQFQVTLYRDQTMTPDYGTFVISLIVNGQLPVADVNLLGAANTLWNGGPDSNGQVLTWTAANNLRLKKCDDLRLVVSNAGQRDEPTAKVMQWAIIFQRLQGAKPGCARGHHREEELLCRETSLMRIA